MKFCCILYALQPELERNEFKSFDQIVAKKLTLTTNMKVAKDIKYRKIVNCFMFL